MTPQILLLVILIGSTIVLSVTALGFRSFSRFMAKEKTKADRFRDLHGPKK